jgi:hypothetical protein
MLHGSLAFISTEDTSLDALKIHATANTLQKIREFLGLITGVKLS